MTATDRLVADLVDELTARERDVVVYREMVQVALAQAAETNARLAALGRQLAALKDELRRFTAMRVQP